MTESKPSKQFWRAQNCAGHLEFQVRNSFYSVSQNPSCWRLPPGVATATELSQNQREPAKTIICPYRTHKQSYVSFPGCVCSYCVYCDDHIMLFLLIEWCYCANQVPTDIFDRLDRLIGCCQNTTMGTGEWWHRENSCHTAHFFLWKLLFSQKSEMIFDILGIIGKEMERTACFVRKWTTQLF